jgi:hypothetical protein
MNSAILSGGTSGFKAQAAIKAEAVERETPAQQCTTKGAD